MNEELLNSFCICSDCVNDEFLKDYIVNKANQDDKCTVCLKKKKTVNLSSDSLFTSFSRYLIRYHYPEYEYNPHWGGEDLPSPFFESNPIVSHNFVDRPDKEIIMEDFFYMMFDLWVENSEIDLYYGHDEGGRGLFANSIKEEKSLTWLNYKKQLQTKNFYLLEENAKNTFEKLIEKLSKEIKKGTVYSRARIGYKEVIKKQSFSEMKMKVAYSENELSSPPIFKSTAGRANRQGVSYLYLASNNETAIGEVRPHPGHYVSIGQFESNEKLKVLDLRFINLIDYFQNPKEFEIFKFLRDISEELSIPILPDEKENYLVTQFISDIIRQIGFDGILFKSSVSNGHNLVAFNSDKFSFKKQSQKLIKITKVQFQHKPVEYDIDLFMEIAREK
jgi:hypothetical protein